MHHNNITKQGSPSSTAAKNYRIVSVTPTSVGDCFLNYPHITTSLRNEGPSLSPLPFFTMQPVCTLRPALSLQGRCVSSKSFNNLQRSDQYVKLAKKEGFRARSAFKLEQIDDRYKLFNDKTRVVVDLGSAPGSWLQAASRRMQMDTEEYRDAQSDPKRNRKHLIGVDFQPIHPIPGVSFVKGDFTDPEVYERMLDMVQATAESMGNVIPVSRAESVAHDMATTIAEQTAIKTGNYDHYHQGRASPTFLDLSNKQRELERDFIGESRPVVDGVMSDMSPITFVTQGKVGQAERIQQVELAEKAKHFALKVLKPGGWFVTKVFNCEQAMRFHQSLSLYFEKTALVRPPAVRETAIESFAVARGFIGAKRIVGHDYASITEEKILELGNTKEGRYLQQIMGMSQRDDQHMHFAHPHHHIAQHKPKRKLPRASQRLRNTMSINHSRSVEIMQSMTGGRDALGEGAGGSMTPLLSRGFNVPRTR